MSRLIQSKEFILGPWHVRPGTNELSHGSEIIKLEQKVMRLLVFFSEHAGRELSKDELLDGVWGEGVHNEEVLTVAVSTLRKALGDDAKTPKYIKTIPRYGYLMLQENDALTTERGGWLKTMVEKAGMRFLIISGLVALLLFVILVQVVVEIVYLLVR